MRNNDIDLHIPDAVATGITVAYNNQTVKLTPQGGSGSAQQYDNSIVYYDYYGIGTILRYTPMLSGVKEDIILAKYTGQNSFTFLLETNGLQLYEDQGQYYLAENQDISAAFYLGQIAIYDAIGRPDLGTMTAETIIPGQKYQLTIAANESFLLDPETVYPVTIDPTVTVRDSADVSGTVEDAPVFSGYANRSFGDYVFNNIGYVDGYKLARTAFRLTSLLADSNYNQLSAEQLNSVSFHLKGSGGQFANLSLHALTENATWTESTLTWNNLGAYSETAYTTVRMGSSVWKTFDITALAKDWKTGAQNPDCGFVLISDSTTSSVSTFSAEYSTVDYRPYVVVNYTGTIALNQVSATLSVGGTLALTATTTPTGQVVSWASEDPTVAEVSEDGVVTALSLGTTTITASLEDGATAECEINVVAKSISLNYNTSDKIASVYKGETITLIATTEPPGEDVEWVSLNPEIATVANGVVTGIGVGISTIKAVLVDGTYAECKVEVLPNTIDMSQETITIAIDSSTKPTITLLPETVPPNLPITWSTSDSSIATVNQSGVVTALKAGDVTVTAALADGTSDSCIIKVRYTGSFIHPVINLIDGEGQTVVLNTPEPIDVIWTSANNSIATVDSNGYVLARNPGIVNITATSPDLIRPVTCKVNVRLMRGMYTLRNASSNLQMAAKNYGIFEGTNVIQQTSTSENTAETYSKIWKIFYLDNGYYSIRPAHKLDLCLYTNGSRVYLTKISTIQDSSTMSSNAQWSITITSNGSLIIENRQYPNCPLMPSNASTNEGTLLVCGSIEGLSNSYAWKYSGMTVEPGILLYNSSTGKYMDNLRKGMLLDEVFTLNDLKITTAVISNTNNDQSWVQWYRDDRQSASVHSQTGTVTAHAYGETVITAFKSIDGDFRYASYIVVVSMIRITGYEIEYNEELWNQFPVINKTNCYSYALNCQVDEYGSPLLLVPGQAKNGYVMPSSANTIKNQYTTERTILDYIADDVEIYGFYFMERSAVATPPEGAYLVAIFVEPGVSYHWYRQNPDGTWSHKYGTGAVSNYDAEGNIIYDPYLANRYYGSGANYSMLIGFFYVTPLNRMYNG